jgi:hypothetical protein
MSEHWEFFPCQMGDDRAFVFVDVRGEEALAQAPTRLVKLRLRYQRPRDNGLPTDEEYQPVLAIEHALEAFAKEGSDRYVGRVTVGGCRYFYFYIGRADSDWDSFVADLAERSGYQLTLAFRDDPQYDGYWRDLYPTDDDWVVIRDLKVIEALNDGGDDGTASRQIDHWIYFPGKAAVLPFIAWAQSNGFVHDAEYSQETDDGKYLVRLHHHGSALIADLSHYTIALRRKAAELGADYDGWESPVITPSSA